MVDFKGFREEGLADDYWKERGMGGGNAHLDRQQPENLADNIKCQVTLCMALSVEYF